MSKPPSLDDLIINELKKESLTGKKLCDRLKINFKESDSDRKVFNESLIRLIDKNKIFILGYDSKDDARKRPQAFQPLPIIFSLVEEDPNHIRNLLHELNGSDREIAEKSRKELIGLYINKINQIEQDNNAKWRGLLERVYSREPSDDEVLWYYAHEKLMNEEKYQSLLKSDEQHALDGHDVIQHIMGNNRAHVQEIRQKYPNLEIFFLKDLKLEREPFDPIPTSITEMFYFTNDNLSKEDFLNNFSFTKPKRMNQREIFVLFDRTLSWIRSQEKGKNMYLESFAIALSYLEESKEKMDELIFKVFGERIIFNLPS